MIKRDLEIVQGDDYAVADGRALLFTSAGENWPDLSTATFALKIFEAGVEGSPLVTVSGTRSLVGAVQHITVPLTASQSAAIKAGTNANEYALQATLSSRRLTLAIGNITGRGVE